MTDYQHQYSSPSAKPNQQGSRQPRIGGNTNGNVYQKKNRNKSPSSRRRHSFSNGSSMNGSSMNGVNLSSGLQTSASLSGYYSPVGQYYSAIVNPLTGSSAHEMYNSDNNSSSKSSSPQRDQAKISRVPVVNLSNANPRWAHLSSGRPSDQYTYFTQLPPPQPLNTYSNQSSSERLTNSPSNAMPIYYHPAFYRQGNKSIYTIPNQGCQTYFPQQQQRQRLANSSSALPYVPADQSNKSKMQDPGGPVIVSTPSEGSKNGTVISQPLQSSDSAAMGSVSTLSSIPAPAPVSLNNNYSSKSYHRTCPFETALMNSRRRIPYSLGASPLFTPPRSQIREQLSDDEKERLTDRMTSLYKELLPSEESINRRKQFLKKLEKLLNEQWPGKDIRVFPFGSTENLLNSEDSDGILLPVQIIYQIFLLIYQSGYLYHYSLEGA